MTPQTDSKALSLLRVKLEEAKLRNPNWSLRAFALRLGMSSGALSETLKGKRPLTLKMRQRMIDRLQLSPMEQREILADSLDPLLKNLGEAHLQLDSDSFHMISDWWNFAILNLVKTVDFKADIGWISQRLGLSKTVTKEAWQRLFRLGYLSKNAKGKIVRRHPKLTTTSDVIDLSIRRAHLEDLKLIEHALLNVRVEEREVNSVTLALKKKDLVRAKDLIRKFQDEFCDLTESEPADDVYRLSISFIPLTARANK